MLWLTDGAKELLLLGPREQDSSCCAPQDEASAFPLPLSSSLGNKLPGGIGAAGPSHGKPWKTMENHGKGHSMGKDPVVQRAGLPRLAAGSSQHL